MGQKKPPLTKEQEEFIDMNHKDYTMLTMARRFNSTNAIVRKYCKAMNYTCKGSKKGIGSGKANQVHREDFAHIGWDLGAYFGKSDKKSYSKELF